MEDRDQRLGFDETGRVRIPDFFDRPEALAHRAGPLNWCCLFVLELSFGVGRPSEGYVFTEREITIDEDSRNLRAPAGFRVFAMRKDSLGSLLNKLR